MKYCVKCGTQISDDTKFCPACGAQTEHGGDAQQSSQPGGQGNQSFENIRNMALNTNDFSGEFDPADIETNKAWGGLAYFLFFLPLVAAPDSKYARFHANQGLVYLLLCVAGGIINSILSALFLAISWRLFFLTSLVSLVVWLPIAAAGIIGLINGFTGKAKELPFIGKIRIIK